MAELLKINPDNPQENKLRKVAEVLKRGGLVIYPTDTVYGIGCDLYSQKAIQKLCLIKHVKPDRLNFSFICYDLSDISHYAGVLSNSVFKVMKKSLPGPFTFVLKAGSHIPKILKSKKKQVGIRVPDHNIPRMLVKELGNPILSSSIRDEDEIVEYTTDPSLILEKFDKLVDIVIDGGYGGNEPSTVVDCTGDYFDIIRQGKGILEDAL